MHDYDGQPPALPTTVGIAYPSKGDFRFFDPEARGIKPDLIKSTISLLVTI